MYLEERQPTQPSDQGEAKASSIKDERQPSSECRESRLEESVTVPPRKAYLEQCRIFGKTDPNAPVFMMMVRLFSSTLATHRPNTDGTPIGPIFYLPHCPPCVLGLLYIR